jgi:hypothetical protein
MYAPGGLRRRDTVGDPVDGPGQSTSLTDKPTQSMPETLHA